MKMVKLFMLELLSCMGSSFDFPCWPSSFSNFGLTCYHLATISCFSVFCVTSGIFKLLFMAPLTRCLNWSMCLPLTFLLVTILLLALPRLPLTLWNLQLLSPWALACLLACLVDSIGWSNCVTFEEYPASGLAWLGKSRLLQQLECMWPNCTSSPKNPDSTNQPEIHGGVSKK